MLLVAALAISLGSKFYGAAFVLVQPNHLSVRPKSVAPDFSRLDPTHWYTATAATGRNNGLGTRSEQNGSLVSSMADSVFVSTLDGQRVSLAEMLQGEGPVVLSCLSHFGDFNAWELTQQYVTALKEGGRLADDNCKILLVGIGSVESAKQFAQDLELEGLSERLTLVADPDGQVSEALGCYRGWLAADKAHRERYPQTDVNPLLKLLGMIFGLGSPGTIEQVIYGYTGDVMSGKGVDGRNWVVKSLLQGSRKGRLPALTPQAFEATPITSSLRPFELATLRLQTGIHIVQNWSKLGAEGDLVTRMGGTFVLDASLTCKWSYFDQGILAYADVEEVCRVLESNSQGDEYIPWTKEQAAFFNKERTEEFVQRQREEQNFERTEREMVAPTAESASEQSDVTPSFFARPVEFGEAVSDPEETLSEVEGKNKDPNADAYVSVLLATEDDSNELAEPIVLELEEEHMEEMNTAIDTSGCDEDDEIVDGTSVDVDVEFGEAVSDPDETLTVMQGKNKDPIAAEYESALLATEDVSIELAEPIVLDLDEERTKEMNAVIHDLGGDEDNEIVDGTSVDVDSERMGISAREKDLFQRLLLQSQFDNAAMTSRAGEREEPQTFTDHDVVVVMEANDEESLGTDKELFQRRLLAARYNNINAGMAPS